MFKSRSGRRRKKSYRPVESTVRRRRPRGVLGLFSVLGPILYFPMMIFYLEFFFHIYMGESLKYLPIWLLFSVSMGFLLSLLAINFSFRVNRIITYVITVLFSVVYIIEMMTKKILASYYQLFSIASTAANNKLTDYMGAIIKGIVGNLFGIFLMLVPVIFIFVIGRNFYNFKKKWIGLSGVVFGAVVVTHLLALIMLHLPWGGEYKPSQIYATNTNVDDQVEQLGVTTMLRLDLKHSIFGVKMELDDNFVDGNQFADQTSEGESAGASQPGESQPVLTGNDALFDNTDTSPNVMNVDLAALAENAPNDDVAWLCNYFNSQTPTNKNKYTGAFEGYNVLFITAEGLTGYAISEEYTPTLWKLSHEGFVFNNFYTPLHFTSTSGGECQNLLGLYPKNGSPTTLPHTGDLGTDLYFNLAQQLGREGYLVQGYHANSNMYNRDLSHPNLGFDWHQFGVTDQESAQQRTRGALSSFEGLELNDSGGLLWPQRDSHAVSASAGSYMNSTQPFYTYYLTISGHMPYSNNRIVAPYREIVRQLPYSETTQNYIATAMEVDKALETLLDELEAAGKLDNTLIVAVPDHIPYFNVDTLEELAGQTFGSSEDLEYLRESAINFDVYKSSLILWSASMEEPVQVDKVVGQVDILPTLSNLLGLEYDSRMLAGKDALSDAEGLVIFSSRCWKSDRGFYNSFTEEFTPAEGSTMTLEEQDSYVSAMRQLVQYQLASTERIVESDFYHVVFGETAS